MAADPALAERFDLKHLPDAFYDDPYPTYRALREHAPVKRLPDGGVFLSRYADVVAVYKDAATYSSDKHEEFSPKYGVSPLYEHHTTSLVFNDPPLHTRVRRLMMGALTQRAIAFGVSAPSISLRTRVCSGGSLKTRLPVWCCSRGEPAPYLGVNSTVLSELNTSASR